MISAREAEEFIRSQTVLSRPPLVPEIRLHLATEITPIWQATEAVLQQVGVEPPFWAFPWAGGQALARYVLDRPEVVSGRSVVDFGAGSGLLAIAAKLAGARSVCAADVDPVACTAARLNAAANRIEIDISGEDLIGREIAAEAVLVGDMCYERGLADRMVRWLTDLAEQGSLVLLGDPGRTYLPSAGLEELASYTVPTSMELEDRTERATSVWRLLA